MHSSVTFLLFGTDKRQHVNVSINNDKTVQCALTTFEQQSVNYDIVNCTIL